ncbi:MAG: threonylcarbamoyl-AMP synthase [Chitinophagaceae bacterium]|nr:threonylcarbamoyl-AMP synthase [Chitinophagaceae bacterium]
MNDFENDINECCRVLEAGGLILYPTDTIWGIGCDATNEKAVEKIYALKKRNDKKSMIILVAEEKDVYGFAENPDRKIFEYLSSTHIPTTVIYEHAKNIAQNLISSDGTIAIRIVKDNFCKALIAQFKKPIVSTSANISGKPFPKNFNGIQPEIKNGVDHIVQHRQNDIMSSQPSSIIKLNTAGKIEILR